MIQFNKPSITGKEIDYIKEAIAAQQLAGNGRFNKQCSQWIEQQTKAHKALLTNSCADALEIAAILLNIGPGDEVIMPSFGESYIANPFVLRGAQVVFVDIRPDTMNIDEQKIQAAITPKTKAIVVNHFAGMAADMDRIMVTANMNNIAVIENAAQALFSTFYDKKLGTIGHFGAYSFHETKNYQCGEGGALILNQEQYDSRAEIVHDSGTDRKNYLRGNVKQHTWKDVGSSYLLGELNAAFLWAQLEESEATTIKRQKLWQRYYSGLNLMVWQERLETPTIPNRCKYNGHLFYIKLKNQEMRDKLYVHLRANDIEAKGSYTPLHQTEAGMRFGRFSGDDEHTTKESNKLMRLPLHNSLTEKDVEHVCTVISAFLK